MSVDTPEDEALVKAVDRAKELSQKTAAEAGEIATELIRLGKPVTAANILQSAAVVAQQCKILADAEWEALQ